MEWKDRWKSFIEDSKILSEDTANLYLKLAEQRLDATVQTANIITIKTNWLIGILLPIATISLGYLIRNGFDYWGITAIMVISMVISVMYFLVKNIMTYRIRTVGEEPQFILNENFVNDKNKKTQFLDLVLNTIEVYQHKIDFNTEINKKRQKNYIIGLIVSLCLPLSLLGSLLVSFLWFPCLL